MTSTTLITEATWNKTNLTWNEILKKFPEEETYLKILGPAKNFPILHAAIGKIPVKDIEMIVEKIQVDLSLRDENGKNALMVALTKAAEYDTKFWPTYFKPIIECILRNARLQSSPPTETKETSETSETKEETTETTTTTTTTTTKNKPTKKTKSIFLDEKGRHLLHITAALGLSWELAETLVKEDSDALAQQDVNTNIWAFMLAACKGEEDGNGVENLNTTFRLLRERPHAIENCQDKYGSA